MTSLAGFARSRDNVERAGSCIAERAGNDWIAADDLYPTLRSTFGWSDAVGKGMISSALGMLAAMGDVERRKKGGHWEYRVSGSVSVRSGSPRRNADRRA